MVGQHDPERWVNMTQNLQFASLDDFLNKWKGSDRKEAIIAELVEQGVMVKHCMRQLTSKWIYLI